MDEEIQEVDNREIEKKELDSIFGDRVEVQFLAEEGYTVSGILSDNCTVEGNQEFKFWISRKEDVPVSSQVSSYLPFRTLRGFKVNRLSINGVEISEDSDSLYLVSGTPLDTRDLEACGEYHIMTSTIREPFCDPVDKVVVLKSFKTGDDLASFFHEKGHSVDDSLSEDYINTATRLQDLIIEDPDGVEDNPEALRLWKELVLREHVANNNAIRIVAKMQSKGERSVELFPGDEELYGFKKFLTTMIIQPIYLGMLGGKFARKSGKDFVNKVTTYKAV
jgi:hypothetical protein